MKIPMQTWSVALAGLLVAGAAQAAPFQNGSFETGPPDIGPYITLASGSTAITGWTVVDGNVDYIGDFWTAEDGSRSLDLSGGGAAGSGVSQTFDTVPGTTYDVRFWLAGNPEGGNADKPLTVAADGASQNYTFTITGHTRVSMGWEQKTFTFTATGASTTLRFTTSNTDAYGPTLDNVAVVARAAPAAAPVPANAPWALALLAGLLGALALRRGLRRDV